MTKTVTLSSWEHVAIVSAVEREMKEGRLHEESAKALLAKLATLVKLKLALKEA